MGLNQWISLGGEVAEDIQIGELFESMTVKIEGICTDFTFKALGKHMKSGVMAFLYVLEFSSILERRLCRWLASGRFSIHVLSRIKVSKSWISFLRIRRRIGISKLFPPYGSAVVDVLQGIIQERNSIMKTEGAGRL